jgi:hypothetical protein
VKPADPLDGLLPPAPPGRDLPHHDRHRVELLAVVGSEHTPGRRRPAPVWLAPLGAALAVLVIVAGVFLLPGVFPGAPAGGGSTPGESGPPGAGGGPHGRPIRLTNSYLVSAAVGLLKVQDSAGGVSVTGANRSTISITAHLVYRGRAPVVTRRMVGSTLELGYTCPARSRNCGVSFDLTVPRDLGAIVDLAAGQIRLSGLSGTISAHTGAGQIRASGLSGTISAYTGAGQIWASGMSAQRVALNTETGMISARFTVPPQLIAAHSGTGSVAIRVPPGTAYKVTASTQVGSVRITVPQAADSSHVIRATTGVGTVTVAGS